MKTIDFSLFELVQGAAYDRYLSKDEADKAKKSLHELLNGEKQESEEDNETT